MNIAVWSEGVHPEDAERVVNGLREAIDHAGQSWSDEYRFRRFDGKYGYFLDRGEQVVPSTASNVWADPDRIIQTLTNLLSNAIKFSPAGSTVTLSAEPGSNDVVFRMRDAGRGIPENKLESVFERFQQVDASDSRDKGGSGLGLAICRSIVHQHRQCSRSARIRSSRSNRARSWSWSVRPGGSNPMSSFSICSCPA